MLIEAQKAKAYIKDLLDRDIFEVKIPRWNKSTKPDYTNLDFSALAKIDTTHNKSGESIKLFATKSCPNCKI